MLDVKYEKNASSQHNEKVVIVNGIYDQESFCYNFRNCNSVNIYNQEIIDILLQERIEEILNCFDELTIPMYRAYYPITISDQDWSHITLIKEKSTFKLVFSLQYDTEEWKNTFSLKDLAEQLDRLCTENRVINYVQDDVDCLSNGFSLFTYLNDTSYCFENAIINFRLLVNQVFANAIKNISKKELHNNINFEFSVSNDIKTACKQYLEYFIQFLEDIGIQADSQISSESHKILFSVIPDNPDIALENIKEALEIYLQLPLHTDDINSTKINSIAVLQLKSNIDHLNSQLALAKATMLAQQKTIEALELISTTKTENIPSTNEETLLNGCLTITEFKKNGYKINLPEILRTLKRNL